MDRTGIVSKHSCFPLLCFFCKVVSIPNFLMPKLSLVLYPVSSEWAATCSSSRIQDLAKQSSVCRMIWRKEGQRLLPQSWKGSEGFCFIVVHDWVWKSMFPAFSNNEWWFPINLCFSSDLPHLGFYTCDTNGRKSLLQNCISLAVTEIVMTTEIIFLNYLYYP